MELELTGRSCVQTVNAQREESDLSTVAHPAQGQIHWYAGYTASRHEKRVAEHFGQRGIEFFLPLYETVHRWNNGRHRVQLPLFPGYIFVRTAMEERRRVLEVPGFVRLVGFDGRPMPLPENEIQGMRDALRQGVVAEPYPYLKTGTRVEIRNGPLRGMTGILLRRQSRSRVVISIDLIMRSMVVEVAPEDVAPLHNVLRGTTDSQVRIRA